MLIMLSLRGQPSLLKLSVSGSLFQVGVPWLKVCSMGRFRNSITRSC